MKLLSTNEVKDRKQSEITRDIARTTDVKETLEKVTNQLNVVNAEFNVALKKQRVVWLKQEEEALARISALTEEIRQLENKKKEALVPIEDREKKAYALFTEAEKVFNDAVTKEGEATHRENEAAEQIEMLQDKLDALSEREQDVTLREQKVLIREKAVEDERIMIKDLSADLSIKLKDLL